MAYETLCMNCMHEIGEEKQCPYCNFRNESPQFPPYLPHRTVIGGRYVLGNVIDANGDGVTYIAFDIERKAVVEVREFLPDTLAIRDENSNKLLIKQEKANFYMSCLASFLDLYRKLARMRGLSALILVLDIIEENNTGYAVIEHMDGAVTLRDYLLSANEGYISWEEARILFMPVLSTLSTLHSAGIIHRGISPNTLYVCADHKIRIGGFSISECRNTGSGIAAEIFSGYAPVEQFGIKAPAGPWTDIYAFAAVLYRSLIGSTPIESTERMQNDRMMIPAKFAEQIPAYVINALINALQIMPEDRTKTIEQLRDELSASPTATIAADYDAEPIAPVPPTYQSADTPRPAPRKRHTAAQNKATAEENKKLAIKAGIIAAAVVLFIFIILCLTVLRGHFGNGGGEVNPEDPTGINPDVTVIVPTFTGMTKASITSQKSYSLDFNISFTEEYNDEVKENYIVSQSVAENTQVPQGTPITLVVSLGKKEIVMIDVRGETFEAAEAKLKEAGFVNIKKSERANDGKHNTGEVYDTPLTVGKEYSYDTTITLTVWADETVETPEGEVQ